MSENSNAPHDCGLCDGPIVRDVVLDGEQWWVCTACGWQHVERDCCEEVGQTTA